MKLSYIGRDTHTDAALIWCFTNEPLYFVPDYGGEPQLVESSIDDYAHLDGYFAVESTHLQSVRKEVEKHL